jgi:hypothetical protein
MIQRVLQSHVIGTDDTVMPMLAPEKARQARMWVYLGDANNPYNVFDFTLSRSRDGPAKFLADYRQTLLADAYGGYDGVVVGSTCRRHNVDPQRYLTQLLTNLPATPISQLDQWLPDNWKL